MKKSSRLYVVDHEGLVGSAMVRKLKRAGYTRIITVSRTKLNLKDQGAVMRFFARVNPEYVFITAQLSGGIQANISRPGEFIYDNLVIETNIIHAAHVVSAKKLLFLGASCVYPKDASQPIREESLMTGPVELTSYGYSVAKIAGIALLEAYRLQYGLQSVSIVPATVYGPGGNFDPASAHVISAFIQKFHDAKMRNLPSVTIWGSGKPKREFIYVDDLVDAAIFLMNDEKAQGLYNVGIGKDVSVRELAQIVKKISGYSGKIIFDASKPDGAMRKLLSNRKAMRLMSGHWSPKISVGEGIQKTYAWYAKHA